MGRRGRQLAEPQIVNLDRAAAAAATGGDHELQAINASQGAVLGGTPGERDLSLLDPDATPLAGEHEVRTLKPPDIVSAGVRELDLEVVYRRIRPQHERNLVVLRQIERQLTMHECVASGFSEIKVQAQGAATLSQSVDAAEALTPSEASAVQAASVSNPSSSRSSPPAHALLMTKPCAANSKTAHQPARMREANTFLIL